MTNIKSRIFVNEKRYLEEVLDTSFISSKGALIMRRLEDIDPFELLHSTPEQLAKQLGVHRGKGGVQDINGAIEDIRSASQV